MRQVTLSDFVGDRIREARRERAKRHEFDRRAYERGAPKRRGKLIAAFGVYALVVIGAILMRPWASETDAEAWGAWATVAFILILSTIPMVIIAIRYLEQRPKMSEATDQEKILIAGEAGESRTAEAFHRVLNMNHDWVLLKGYKNSKGEIDQILVGPNGVTAIEIKKLQRRDTHKRRLMDAP